MLLSCGPTQYSSVGKEDGEAAKARASAAEIQKEKYLKSGEGGAWQKSDLCAILLEAYEVRLENLYQISDPLVEGSYGEV